MICQPGFETFIYFTLEIQAVTKIEIKKRSITGGVMMNLKIFYLAILSGIFGVGQVGAVEVNSCTNITSSGTYTLTQDIVNSSATCGFIGCSR